MAAKSDYLENKDLDHNLGTTTYTKPAAVYIGLYTTAPTDAAGGTEVTTSGTAYARQACAFNAAASGATANTSDVVFPVATASYGTVVAFGIFDASTAGNLLYWNTITSVAISTNDQMKFLAGDIDVTED